MKKVGKTTRPFRYDLNQVPYDYTVEVRNRFKGLDLVDRVADELWTEVCSVVQKVVTKIIPTKEGKVVYLRRIYKELRQEDKQGRMGKIYPIKCRFPRIEKRDKRAFFNEQCKEIEENNRMGKTSDLFKKIRIPREISCKVGLNKGQKWYGPKRSRRY